MEISSTVKPRGIGEIRDIHNQRVSLPVALRVSHPQHVRIRLHLREMNGALGIRKFEDHLDFGVALNDLEWMRHVHGARCSRLEALQFRIAIDPVLFVLLLSGGRPRLVWNLVALNHPKASRNPAERTQREHGSRENHGVGEQPGLGNHGMRLMGQKVPVGGVVGFPNPVEVGFADNAARGVRNSGGDRRRAWREECEKTRCHNGCRHRNGTALAKISHRTLYRSPHKYIPGSAPADFKNRTRRLRHPNLHHRSGRRYWLVAGLALPGFAIRIRARWRRRSSRFCLSLRGAGR